MKVIGIIREKKITTKQNVWIKSNLKFVLWNLWSELELIFISYLYLFVKNFSVKKKTKTTKNKKTDSNDAVLISAREPQALKIPLVYVLTKITYGTIFIKNFHTYEKNSWKNWWSDKGIPTLKKVLISFSPRFFERLM